MPARLGLTGMILTKETYLIHVIALLLAVPSLYVLEQFSRSSAEPCVRQRWGDYDLSALLAVSLGAIIFFYSGAFMAWEDFQGLWTTFAVWTRTGTEQDGGHVKEWFYWIHPLLTRYEWVALFGLAAAPFLAWPRSSRTLRYLAIGGGGVLCAYSIIPYKTPWCIIVVVWPFFFVFGEVITRVFPAGSVWRSTIAAVVTAALLGHSAVITTSLNFFRYTDDTEPYVYVQTQKDIEKLLKPLEQLVEASKANYHLHGIIFLEQLGDGHPLPWLLGDFTNVETLSKDSPAREVMDADFLLVQDPYVSDVEDRLKEEYFRTSFFLRGSSALTGNLYLNASRFSSVFPGKQPEFQPVTDVRPAVEIIPSPEAP